jgi:hypothetical protein
MTEGNVSILAQFTQDGDILDGSARTNVVVPPNTGLATSASLVFVRADDNQPVKASKSWHKMGIQQASNIFEWHRPEMIL